MILYIAYIVHASKPTPTPKNSLNPRIARQRTNTRAHTTHTCCAANVCGLLMFPLIHLFLLERLSPPSPLTSRPLFLFLAVSATATATLQLLLRQAENMDRELVLLRRVLAQTECVVSLEYVALS